MRGPAPRKRRAAVPGLSIGGTSGRGQQKSENQAYLGNAEGVPGIVNTGFTVSSGMGPRGQRAEQRLMERRTVYGATMPALTMPRRASLQKEFAMKRLLWILPIGLLVLTAGAFADSVTFKATSVTLLIVENDGTGDNAFLEIQGGGVSLQIGCGTTYEWFNEFTQFAPGTSGFGNTNVFFDNSGVGHLGPYGPDDFAFDSVPTLFVTPFTLPINGKNVTVFLPASLSNLTGEMGPDGQRFTIILPPGKLKMGFGYDPVNGVYLPDIRMTFTSTPEPGTLVLMGTGLLLTLGSVRRKRSISR